MLIMAKTDTFHCSVITPERAVLECEATFAAFPAHDGEMGVLRDRAPLLCKMGVGILRVESADGQHLLYVDGGFAQVVGNELTLLTEQAKKTDEIDAETAKQAMIDARSMKTPAIESVEARSSAIKRASVQLELAKSV